MKTSSLYWKSKELIVTFSRDTQSAKHKDPINLTEGGIVISFNEEQPSKEAPLISTIDSGNSTLGKEEQHWKDQKSRIWKEEGRINSFNAVQLENEYWLKIVIVAEGEISTISSEIQYAKTWLPISLTKGRMLIFFKDEHL